MSHSAHLADRDSSVQRARHHEGADPHVLLEHRLGVLVALLDVASQPAAGEPRPERLGPSPLRCGEAVRVGVGDAVDGRLSQLGDCEVQQYLRCVG